jgi:hypothetical protein
MVGFPSHFAIGLILSLPFVVADKKNRYRTLLVGGVAAVVPDIDAPAMIWDLSSLGLEHRGVLHWFITWFLVTLIVVVAVGLVTYDKFQRDKPGKVSEFVYDKALYLGAMSIGWLSHLIVDFSMTDFNGDEGWIYSLSLTQIWYLDNIMGFITAIILGSIILFEVRERKKTAETVISHHKELELRPQLPQERFTPFQMILPQLRIQSDQNEVPIGQVATVLGIEREKEVTELLKNHEKSLQDTNKKSDFYIDEKKGTIIFKSHLEKWLGRKITDFPSFAVAGGFIVIAEVILSILLIMIIWFVLFIT